VALEVHFQGLVMVPPTLAFWAGYSHVGQKVHLDLLNSFPFARFTAPPLGVEGEALCPITTHFGFRQLGEELTDGGKDPCIGGRSRPPRSPERDLVNQDHLAEGFGVVEAIKRGRGPGAVVELSCEGAIKGLDHQGRLTRT